MSKVYCGTAQIKNQNHAFWSRNLTDIVLFKIKPSNYYHCVTTLKTYLDKAELDRADRYHFEKDRHRFIICRALLKLLLAKQSRTDVTNIKIGVETNKKPYLVSNKSIHFNLSHTDDLAVIALNNNHIGVDLEYLNKDFDFKEVLTHVYSNTEINIILKSINQLHTFYKFWTRKEAIVKATGSGISDYLPLIPAIDGHHLVDSKLLDGYKSLQVFSFDIDEHYAVSIATINEKFSLDKLQIFTLPSSLEELISFSI